MMALEVEEVINNQVNTIVKFRNGSYIEIVTANQNARCGRANMLIIDEARMVNNLVIESVLKKFMTATRQAGFMELEKYADYPLEKNQEIYLTSAWYANNWCYSLFRDYAAGMITGKDYFVAALPYQLSIKEKLLDRRQVEADMASSDFNEVSWTMEMCAEFWSGADGALYSYDAISPARQLKYALLPPKLSALLSDKRVRIPQKAHNEVRIVSADIALMQSTGKTANNDATAVFVNQMLLNENGSRAIKNIVYTQNYEGLRAEEQALEIRRLFAQYDGDWLVIDARGLGLPVVDLLMADIYDPETGETYCALGCYNNEEINKRCKVRNAPKKIWAILATNDINSQCALALREEFRQNNIRLLTNEENFDEDFEQISGFSRLSLEDKLRIKAVYVNTSLTVNELINLETEVRGNYVRVKEKSGCRKDRFSSLSYNIWLATMLEKEHTIEQNRKDNFEDYIFQFRQPKTKR